MKRTSYAAAWPTALHDTATEHLLRTDGQEDLCFGLWYPSRGATRTTALMHRLVLPEEGERRVHGNASFLPAYFERAIGEAMEAKAGLAFMHSHGGPGWQDMSWDDVRAEEGHAAATLAATGLPLLGLTLGTDGAWSARLWERVAHRSYNRHWCRTVRVVGESLALTFHDHLLPRPKPRPELQRTISAWGEDAQATIARLHAGVVGAGSVGAIVAETLARMGVGQVTLIDFDRVEPHNLDRLLHATREDAMAREPKVDVLARALRKSATAEAFELVPLQYSVAEEEGFRAALDCDILFSCVDRPWARSVLNFIAYAHLIPVVDGGIRIEVTRRATLRRADWRAHVAAPGRRCLECLKQYDPAMVALERAGHLDDPRYIAGLPEDHPARKNENVFAFSLAAASLEILQALMMVVTPAGIGNPGAQHYHFVPGRLDIDTSSCEPTCPYTSLVSSGDSAGLLVTGRHVAAEASRTTRPETPVGRFQQRLPRLLRRLLTTARH